MAPNNRIREVRQLQGLTQAQLAERIGKTQADVSRIEIPTVAPRPKTLRKIADALHVDVRELLAV